MAERVLTGRPSRGLTTRAVWARIGLVYLAARAVTTLLLLAAAELSGPASRFGADATLGTLVVGWDAQWYWLTAEQGYPTTLPLTPSGEVAENSWAFMPLYAVLARVVGAPFGSWAVGASAISLVAGYAAALVLHRLLRDRLDEAAAMWAVVFFCSGPLAALFHVGYAESLFLLWLFVALLCVARRRWGWLWLLIPLMGYTRPGVLAFALFLGLYGIWRWTRRRDDPLRAVEAVQVAALAAWASVIGFSWQVFAWLATGRADAYLATELAWRRTWLADPPEHFVPFEGFWSATQFWFERWGLTAPIGYAVLAAVVVLVAALLMFEPHVRRLGIEVRLWSASYLVYLLAVFFPQSSIFRLLVPVSPLWGAVAQPRSVLWRVSVLALCVAGQAGWIYAMYALGNDYTRVP